jgi:hypothetical protein
MVLPENRKKYGIVCFCTWFVLFNWFINNTVLISIITSVMKQESKNLYFWSRKFHIHLGLFLLLFIWLFSLSGLLLNHGSKWKFAGFWDERKEKLTITPVLMNSKLDSAALLKSIMRQLKISGEISMVYMAQDSMDFRVSIPGHERNLHINKKEGTCTQKELTFNGWGKMRTLHTFNGVNKNYPNIGPNWIVTRIWQFSKDLIAIGLIVLCISSWIMWYKLRKKYKLGLPITMLGLAISLYLIFLL